MAGVDIINFDLPRNGSIGWTGVIDDAKDGVTPTDITNDAFAWQVRAVGGSATLLASAVITKSNPTIGEFQILLKGSQLDAVGGVMETVALTYDFVRTFPDGVPDTIMRGTIYLQPEVTQ